MSNLQPIGENSFSSNCVPDNGYYGYRYTIPKVVKTTTTTREYDKEGRVVKETTVVIESKEEYYYTGPYLGTSPVITC